MSIKRFADTGLVPISHPIAVAAGKSDLDLMFVYAGTLKVIATTIIATQPAMNNVAESLVAEKVNG